MKRVILLATGIAALLTLASCDSIGDGFGRKSNASTTTGSNATSGASQGNSAGWGDTGPARVDVPTPSIRSKCPGATNAEIDADKMVNGHGFTCVSATREAAK